MIPLNKKSLGVFAACTVLCMLAPFVHTNERASVTLNPEAIPYVYKLIGEGRVILDRKGAWGRDQPSAPQKNEFIRLRGFEEYSKWNLGIDGHHEPDHPGAAPDAAGRREDSRLTGRR